ncbi:hypothetical protein OCU04_004839 [Sclerotinia nivalis]|uniref:Uncharacterized protein n=1 Tax=Sclerotinia nivalis TaxID=352851 RepID=A0A9X0ARM1_9HELO|nr:hypothetical protein OCU04_004839 [Sclerotinia nivalis]
MDRLFLLLKPIIQEGNKTLGGQIDHDQNPDDGLQETLPSQPQSIAKPVSENQHQDSYSDLHGASPSTSPPELKSSLHKNAQNSFVQVEEASPPSHLSSTSPPEESAPRKKSIWDTHKFADLVAAHDNTPKKVSNQRRDFEFSSLVITRNPKTGRFENNSLMAHANLTYVSPEAMARKKMQEKFRNAIDKRPDTLNRNPEVSSAARDSETLKSPSSADTKDNREIKVQCSVAKDDEGIQVQSSVVEDGEGIQSQSSVPKDGEELKVQSSVPKDSEEIQVQSPVAKDDEGIQVQSSVDANDDEEVQSEPPAAPAYTYNGLIDILSKGNILPQEMKDALLQNVNDPYALYILWCRDQLADHISWGQDPVVPGKTSTKVIFIETFILLTNDRETAQGPPHQADPIHNWRYYIKQRCTSGASIHYEDENVFADVEANIVFQLGIPLELLDLAKDVNVNRTDLDPTPGSTMKNQFLNKASTLNGQYQTAFENWFRRLTGITRVHTVPGHLTRCDDCTTPQCLICRYNGALMEYHENLSLKYVPTKPRDRIVKSAKGDEVVIPWSQTPLLHEGTERFQIDRLFQFEPSADEAQHPKKKIQPPKSASRFHQSSLPQFSSSRENPLVFWITIDFPSYLALQK